MAISNRKIFQAENDNVLKYVLGERFFNSWRERGTNPDLDLRYSLASEASIELYVTSTCNYQCEYCYLHGNSRIYPEEANNFDTILSNLEKVFDYLITNAFHPKSIEFFSGEIWHTAFGEQILEMTYQATLRGLKCDYFMIPSNCSFVNHGQSLHKIQGFIDKFAANGFRLQFSISMDGKVVDNINRPAADKESEHKNDLFYENIFLFARHNGFTFHPMVAACSIEYWIANFEWWKSMCAKYHMNAYRDLMLLEVRNNDWTEEKIQSYCKFLRYLLTDRLDRMSGDAATFTDTLISRPVYDPDFCGSGYLPYYLTPVKTFASCTIANYLTVRLGDLAICPCHRTAYDEHLYGKFIVEDGRITDIESNNIYNAVRILMANDNICHIKCDSCVYSEYCIRNCYGSQLEQNNDPFLPIEGVCALFKAKYRCLCELYKETGVSSALQEIRPTDMQYPLAQQILSFIERVEQDVAQEKKEEKRNPSAG